MRFLSKMSVAATALAATTSMASAMVVDLGFALDESGSVFASDFDLARSGLAAALSQIPTSGDTTYRVSVVKFDGSVETVVPVTTIDSQAALDGVVNQVNNASQQFGSTAIGDAIEQLVDNFEVVGLGDSTIFNVTTDGGNNTGTSVAAASTTAAAAGVDNLSFEAVGPGADTGTLLGAAFPGTPVLIDNAGDIPDLGTGSFVFTVDSFEDYVGAIDAKIEEIIIDTGGTPTPGITAPIPLPAGFPLLLGGLGILALARRRRSA